MHQFLLLQASDEEPITLQRQTPTTFICNAPHRLMAFVLQHGYYEISLSKATYEIGRLRHNNGSIIVVFNTGTIMVQGQKARETSDRLLARFGENA